MSSRSLWLATICLAATLAASSPRNAAAIDLNEVDVSDRNYLAFVIFGGIFNPDCYYFGDDDSFTASYGLILGEWSAESETFALFFTFNYVEVEILSATEATITCITAMDNTILLGLIETDDDDMGFVIGIESEMCRVPARSGDEDLKPFPDDTVPPRKGSR